MTKILVTGATGCLGRNLCSALRQAGYTITATGRNSTIGQHLAVEGVTFQACDLTDRDAVLTLLQDHSHVVHCAALSSAWGPDEHFRQANEVATANLVTACLKHHVRRFIHISTTAVYFDYRHRTAIRECDPLANPMVNAYARSKWRAEQIVLNAVNEGLEPLILRPRGIFGPYDQSLFPRLLRAARLGILPLPDGGRAIVDMTAVSNVCHAIGCALEADHDSVAGIYNITNGEPWPIHLILKRIIELTGLRLRLLPVPYMVMDALAAVLEAASRQRQGTEPVLTRYGVGLLAKHQTLDINLTRRKLGYQPKISMDEGLKHFAAWWRGHLCQ